uniref:Uncharacterized protein n=1 Tax=Anguilla anguilla TaxID=7936 RepID=A0A0E9SQH8_ANGAN
MEISQSTLRRSILFKVILNSQQNVPSNREWNPGKGLFYFIFF